MATHRPCVVCVLMCVLYSVHGYTITGTISMNNLDPPSKVELTNYVNGEDFNTVLKLTLDRLVNAQTLSSLTLANFKSISTLLLTDISLENVPVFENTSISTVIITENKIKSVPASAFSGPRPSTLELRKNEIQSMADRSVNVGVRYLRLGCNKLSHFSQSWFEEPGSIEGLDLTSNRIEHIQNLAFHQMPQLAMLHLSYNRITRIGSEAFNSRINHLLLDFNNITQLSTEMFVRREKPMVTLHLHHNQLSFLPEALVVQLRPITITLVGNPWQCQCLRDIERWLREHDSTLYDIPSRRGEPVCVVPRNFASVCVPAVDPELQQTYANGLSPVQGCTASPCKPCLDEDIYLGRLT